MKFSTLLNEWSTWREVLRFADEHSLEGWTYIIMGKPGPTGKTFICKQLQQKGYSAIEISSSIYDLVEYKDSLNHFQINPWDKTVTIVLNQPLRRD